MECFLGSLFIKLFLVCIDLFLFLFLVVQFMDYREFYFVFYIY